jgi:hypothetical protein
MAAVPSLVVLADEVLEEEVIEEVSEEDMSHEEVSEGDDIGSSTWSVSGGIALG